MQGIIRTWDVVAHPLLIIQAFGAGFLWKALLANRGQTFLAIVEHYGPPASTTAEMPDTVDRCIDLERCARKIYEDFARRFSKHRAAAGFFCRLAGQERDHAEALGICRAMARRDGWIEKQLAPWRNLLPELEGRMQAARARAEAIADVHDALAHVIDIELSEINRAYLAVVASSRSPLVQGLAAFARASSQHIDDIVRTIPAIDRSLTGRCETLLLAYRGPASGA